MPRLKAASQTTIRARGWWSVAFLAVVLAGGCSNRAAPISVAKPAPAVADARARSLERALSGVNAATVRAWVNRYSAPGGARAAPAAPRRVYIDIEALARRHAAWQLADALQNGARVPTPPRQLDVHVSAVSTTQTARGLTNRPPSVVLPAFPKPDELPARAERVVTATASQSAALSSSRATLADFLDDLKARQSELENAQSQDARRALEDRIRASTRGAVEAIGLEPVSPAVALELSNLRLQLLSQLRVPINQRAAAAAQIERIEARLNAIWSAQTQAQTARLRAAFEELPARLRREGLVALDQAAARRELERQAARLQLRQAVQARLNGAAPQSDIQTLRLLLPPTRVASADLSVDGNSSFQTNARRVPSVSPDVEAAQGFQQSFQDARALSRSSEFAPANIAALRAQARRDARQWASKLALSWGAQWTSDKTAPARTAQALKALFGDSATA